MKHQLMFISLALCFVIYGAGQTDINGATLFFCAVAACLIGGMVNHDDL